MTTGLTFHCCEQLAEFEALGKEWELFTGRHFPGCYARTHGWLCAWWKTYHHGRSALIYTQRDSDGRIVAAAPLFICRESFGGFPVQSVAALGRGLGGDDFLITPAADRFVRQVFADLARRRWHVLRLNRLLAPEFIEELKSVIGARRYRADLLESKDHLVQIPGDFSGYLRSRSRKFRRNLNLAVNRLQREGEVSLLRLDPQREMDLVYRLGKEVASTSWQLESGKSHFCDSGGGDFYSNLGAQQGEPRDADFFVLMSNQRPVAYLLGCRREKVYYAVDTAFHAAFRNVSAGRVLFSRFIETLIEEQSVELLDFEGTGEYKDDYSNSSRTAVCLTLYNSSLYPAAVKTLRDSAIYRSLRSWFKGGGASGGKTDDEAAPPPETAAG